MPPTPSACVSGNSISMREALVSSAPLAKLFRRLDESSARFGTACRCFPQGLESHVKPGSLDADAWTLLAANGAVAAKLRQLKPLIDQALADDGWPALNLRIKVVAEPGASIQSSG